MFLIDANIILEVLLEQERYKECEEFLEKVRRGEIEASISRFSLYSIELIMIRYGKIGELKLFLTLLSTFRGLTVITTLPIDDVHVLEVMRKFNLDFDDAINYYIVKKYKMKGIISFDKHFDKTDIKRVEPVDVL
ncbi:MAG: type II toxin-antitoxin system VapC family toxin [Thermoproteales archaeon]|nr:type II toxin-antitoxin system VapC family toxin [Thermoproteales archaeon]RLE66529.1 MAG: PIN domain nuclease [Thermoprotei archaeon]